MELYTDFYSGEYSLILCFELCHTSFHDLSAFFLCTPSGTKSYAWSANSLGKHTHIPDREIATGLRLFLDWERPLFYQQYNWFDVTIQQFMPTMMCLAKQQQNSSLSSKFEAIVDVGDIMTLAHSRFSCLLFTTCADYDLFWCVNPNTLK